MKTAALTYPCLDLLTNAKKALTILYHYKRPSIFEVKVQIVVLPYIQASVGLTASSEKEYIFMFSQSQLLHINAGRRKYTISFILIQQRA